MLCEVHQDLGPGQSSIGVEPSTVIRESLSDPKKKKKSKNLERQSICMSVTDVVRVLPGPPYFGVTLTVSFKGFLRVPY